MSGTMASWLGGLLGGAGLPTRGLLDDPTMRNPVGWSSIYPAQYMTNPDPNVSPVVSRGSMTDLAALGTLGRKGYVTAAELPAAEDKARQAIDYGMIAASASSPIGIRAFHGSPHTFDRFDMSKLGTGEGAQAYGHGLYFSGNEGVARSYRDTLAPPQAFVNGEWFAGKAVGGTPQWFATKYLEKHKGDVHAAAADLLAVSSRNKSINDPFKNVSIMEEAANILPDIAKNGAVMKSPGSMYEVNLRTSPERLLDWDKPLSAQPSKAPVALAKAGYPQSNIEAMMGGRGEYTNMPLGEGQTGLPRFLQKPDAVQALRKAGIDGIQYLDATSRVAGEGTRNYVMFDDKLIDILRRYGLLGMLGGGGASGLLGSEAPQQ